MSFAAASDLALQAGAGLSALAALWLAMRRSPRPGPWPVVGDLGVPALIAVIGVGAWMFSSVFLASLLGEFPALTSGLDDPLTREATVSHAAQFLGRLVAVAICLSLVVPLVVPTDPMRARPQLATRTLLWGLGLYVLLLPLVMLLSPPIDDSGQMPQEAVRELLAMKGAVPRTVLFLNVVIAAPLHEEIVFRGLLQGALRRHFPGPVAIAVTSGVFALLHPGVEVPVFLLGVALGFLYERSRGLALPLIVHLLHNFITFLYITVGLS